MRCRREECQKHAATGTTSLRGCEPCHTQLFALSAWVLAVAGSVGDIQKVHAKGSSRRATSSRAYLVVQVVQQADHEQVRVEALLTDLQGAQHPQQQTAGRRGGLSHSGQGHACSAVCCFINGLKGLLIGMV